MNWNAVIAICTAAAAVFTAVMAFYTRVAIKRGQQQFHDAQQHEDARHQDAYRPIVVLEPFGGIGAENRNHIAVFDSNSRMGDRRLFKIACLVRNVGVGPALNVRLSFRAMGKLGYGFTQELAPVRHRAAPPMRLKFGYSRRLPSTAPAWSRQAEPAGSWCSNTKTSSATDSIPSTAKIRRYLGLRAVKAPHR